MSIKKKTKKIYYQYKEVDIVQLSFILFYCDFQKYHAGFITVFCSNFPAPFSLICSLDLGKNKTALVLVSLFCWPEKYWEIDLDPMLSKYCNDLFKNILVKLVKNISRNLPWVAITAIAVLKCKGLGNCQNCTALWGVFWVEEEQHSVGD